MGVLDRLGVKTANPVLDRLKAAAPAPTQSRVLTRLLDSEGLTSEEVKRRAAADEPILQKGLRPATIPQEINAQVAAAVTGVGSALAGTVGIVGDVASTPIREVTAGVKSLKEGKGFKQASIDSMEAVATLPISNTVTKGIEDFQKTLRNTMGVDEGAATSPTTHITQLAAELLTPIPGVGKAAEDLKKARADKIIAFYERKMAEAVDEPARKVLEDEMRRTVTSLAPPAPTAPVDIAAPHGTGAAAAEVPKVELGSVPSAETDWLAEANARLEGPKPESLIDKAKRAIRPLKAQDETVQRLWRERDAGEKLAKATANEEAHAFPALPEKEGLETILNYEKGAPTPFSGYIKEKFAALKEKAHAAGIEFGTQENYLPQMYKDKPADVQKAIVKYMVDQKVAPETIRAYVDDAAQLPEVISRRLGLNPSFTKTRVFPSYKVAMEYGLTPKYTHPAQLVAAYSEQLDTALANRKLIDGLMSEGKLVPSASAPAGWKPVDLTFSPKAVSAEPKLAEMLNGYFRDEGALNIRETSTKGVARLSRLGQEVTMSAGVPYTQLNAFSTGQLIREVTSGNLKAVVPYLRSNFSGLSAKYFVEKAPTLKKMAAEGIDLAEHIGKYETMYKNLSEKGVFDLLGAGEVKEAAKTAGGKIASTANKAFNERVFGSFMPQLYIGTFETAEAKFLKKGLAPAEAQKAAADVVRNFHGLMENVGRGRGTEDFFSAAFFAPKFRESVINTLWNTGKSVTTEIRNPAFYKNRNLAKGMILTFGSYDALNLKLTGHHMWENAPGKEFALDIPLSDGDTHVYIEYMPSFLAFARNMVSGGIATAKGDFSTATQKFGSVTSIPVKLTAELWANKDYFGRPIYDDAESTESKVKKIAAYAGLQTTHPYIREFLKQKFTQKDKPLYQSLSEAAELPLKFGSEKQIQKQRLFQMRKEMLMEQRRRRIEAKDDQ